MSIYATLWQIQVQDPASPFSEPVWVTITAQAVPPHIGSPTPGEGYESGDPYGTFLPPPVETDGNSNAPYNRAVVFIADETEKGTQGAHPQQYVDPLLVLTGKEYAEITFENLLSRLEAAVRSGPRVIGEFFGPDGAHRVFTEEEEDED